jgi:excisionase family DNA binding protein
MTKEDIPPYLTIAQAVTFSHFSEPTIRKAISEGKLRATKPLARDARIERGDFERWMATGTSTLKSSGLQGPGGINYMDIRKLEYLRSIAPESVARFEDEQGRSFLAGLAALEAEVQVNDKESP